jgi:uncharacterized protein
MQVLAGSLQLSASDLVGHLNCRYLTDLDRRVAMGKLPKPSLWDPVLEVLAERGRQHETGYVDHLRAKGLAITAIEGLGVDAAAVAQTLAAMKAGAPVIVQAAFRTGQWIGRADVLLRVEKPSPLGAWSYEVVDTKLAQETKGGTVLQLCLYSDLLTSAQGAPPEFAYVVTPESDYEPESYRVTHFAAYYRRVRRRLEEVVASSSTEQSYPDPNPHCDVCRWRVHCEDKRHADDHLSLVAGISKAQIGELEKHAVGSTAALGSMPIPLQWKPDRGAAHSYERVREQARIQVQGRSSGQVIYETLPVVEGFGLCLLPPPSPGDIFLDFEGDPFVAGGGREYLLGYALAGKDGMLAYAAHWALTAEQEKAAFEAFVDLVMTRLETHPDLHIYHYAPYEPAALKRLMGRYSTRENEIDRMLRAGLFVDLYAVVRHGLRASVESYSIKKLEPLYAFARAAPLSDAGRTLVKVQACLELNDFDGITGEDRAIVEAYNRDDCLSAARLRDWLEQVRSTLIAKDVQVPRPAPGSGEASEELAEWKEKIAALVERLTHNVPLERAERTVEQHARWLLAYTLDWHRREEKAVWWEYFRLSDLSAEELLDERAALSGLTFLAKVGGTTAAPVHRYRFAPQETQLRGGEELRSRGGEKLGKVEAVSLEERTVDIKKRRDTKDFHPDAIFGHERIPTRVLADALVRLGEHVDHHGIEGIGSYQSARDLLLLTPPRLGGQELQKAGETAAAAGVRLAPHLEGGVLPIQGPPGAGKTYTGARMIAALAQAGRKIGITANSHKVIRNLLDEVVEASGEAGFAIRCIQKVSENEPEAPGLMFTTDNGDLFDAVGSDCHVAAGTAWLWARPEAQDVVDVLFIDEAAQMSLANVLAVSHAAKTVILLGDPRQLEHPMQGSHPEGTDVSALDHILDGHVTIPSDRGLFLEETWRLHPAICAFTSEMFYESRLHSRPGLDRQVIKSSGRANGFGLRYLPVSHQGNQSSSPEEADAVRDLVAEILGSNATWIDRHGKEASIALSDILIIAPYNAQVFELQDRLSGARIGTVDKFQGQEAPIVIYSMTTSSHADAPRGMDFLYSANRLNVATSRAKCLCILVCAAALFEAECRTPRQMQLANAFCRYAEVGGVLKQ